MINLMALIWYINLSFFLEIRLRFKKFDLRQF